MSVQLPRAGRPVKTLLAGLLATVLTPSAATADTGVSPDSVSPDSVAHDLPAESVFLRPRSPHEPNFWVVNFGTARTLPPRRFGFAAGLGGQAVFLGNPQKTSALFTIPHAGFRLGLTNRIDVGLRLAPIPLPFASVGPGLGVNLDAKYRLTKPESKIDLALILGAGGAHVLIEDRESQVLPKRDLAFSMVL